MKNIYLTTALLTSLLATPAIADPTVMVGISFNISGTKANEPGITAKILSDDGRDKFVGVAGVTYFYNSNDWGIDAGLGYNLKRNTISMSYDFLNDGISVALGMSNLADEEFTADSS